MSLFPARMKNFLSKVKALEWSQHFSHCNSMGIFSDAQGQLTPQSMVGSGTILNPSETLWLSSLPAEMMKIRLKNKGARMFTTLYIDFSDAQGQITPESVVGYGQNSNSSKLSYMYLLPAKMKMIQSKMKGLEWSQNYSHYKFILAHTDAGSVGILYAHLVSSRLR